MTTHLADTLRWLDIGFEGTPVFDELLISLAENHYEITEVGVGGSTE